MRVLLVEDSPTDAELVAEELEECPFAVELDCVEDAEAALARLRAPSPPDLILLDLGLPGRDGASLLAELRAAETTATLPVIVLSTSQAQHDILATHDLHADGYISKPLRVDEFVFTVMRLRAGQARHSE
jgi:DNA-binding response OmpR family regulator